MAILTVPISSTLSPYIYTRFYGCKWLAETLCLIMCPIPVPQVIVSQYLFSPGKVAHLVMPALGLINTVFFGCKQLHFRRILIKVAFRNSTLALFPVVCSTVSYQIFQMYNLQTGTRLCTQSPLATSLCYAKMVVHCRILQVTVSRSTKPVNYAKYEEKYMHSLLRQIFSKMQMYSSL